MAEPLTKAVEIFYCFASEDRALQNELGKHLSNFKRQYIITEWYHAMIGPGEERTRPINLHLNTAQLFLLLVSPDFMASDQCYFKMMRAVESCDAKENPLVFPIHLRPVDYQDAPFSEFQILPDGCEPFTTSPNRDEAYQKIVEVI